MRRSLTWVREELFHRRDRYMEKKQKRSAILTGTGSTVLIAGFLLGIIVLPGLLKRPQSIDHSLFESADFRAFWAEHEDDIIWWEQMLYADSIETELSAPLDTASTAPSPVVLCKNLTDVLGSHDGYYAVLPYIGISFDSIKDEIYQDKTLSEWKDLADAVTNRQEAYPDEEKLTNATQYLTHCRDTIFTTYTVEGMTLAVLSEKIEQLSLSAFSQDQEECVRLKTLLGETTDQAYADPIFDGRSYNELLAEVKALEEAKRDWEKEQLTSVKNKANIHQENFQEALNTINRTKLTTLFTDWDIPYFYHDEHEVYVLFMTDEIIQKLSALGYGNTKISLIRCNLSFASYELNPDRTTSEEETTQDTEEIPSDSYAMSDTQLQTFLDKYREEIQWSRNSYFFSYSGRIYPYEDYLPGNTPGNHQPDNIFVMASELYDPLAAGDSIAPYYAVWFRPFETETSEFTQSITSLLDCHALPHYTGTATGIHEWKERSITFTVAFLTLEEILELHEDKKDEQENPFAIMALLPKDIIKTAGFDTEETEAPKTEPEDPPPADTDKSHPSSKTYYKYDENENLVAINTYEYKKDIDSYQISQIEMRSYDSQNRILSVSEETVINGFVFVRNRSLYSYDTDGTVTMESYYDTILQGTTIERYHAQSRTKETREYDLNGNLQSIITEQFDADGNTILYEKRKGEQEVVLIKQEFDAHGRLVYYHCRTNGGEGHLVTQYHSYDEKGHRIETVTYPEDCVTEYRYDTHGNLVYQKDLFASCAYDVTEITYQYDEADRIRYWQSITTHFDSDGSLLESREQDVKAEEFFYYNDGTYTHSYYRADGSFMKEILCDKDGKELECLLYS